MWVSLHFCTGNHHHHSAVEQATIRFLQPMRSYPSKKTGNPATAGTFSCLNFSLWYEMCCTYWWAWFAVISWGTIRACSSLDKEEKETCVAIIRLRSRFTLEEKTILFSFCTKCTRGRQMKNNKHNINKMDEWQNWSLTASWEQSKCSFTASYFENTSAIKSVIPRFTIALTAAKIVT